MGIRGVYKNGEWQEGVLRVNVEEEVKYREAVEQAIDDEIDEVARERKDTITDIPLGQVVAGLDLDVGRIVVMSEDFARDED